MAQASNTKESLNCTLAPYPEVEHLGTRWQSLSSSVHQSFFTSWRWVSTWLQFGDEERFLFSVTSQSGADVALGILSLDSQDGSFWLNSPSRQEHRLIFCEYSDLLIDPAYELSLFPFLIDAVGKHPLNICGSLDDFSDLESHTGRVATRRNKRPAPFVDLETVRSSSDGLDPLLSRNTRQQIARAARLEGDSQDIRVEVAAPGAAAQEALQTMAHLQTKSFSERQLASSFDSAFFLEFASTLVSNQATDGEVELLSVLANDKCIGILMNLIHGGTVANYQSGFAFRSDPKAKPGYLVHKAAIEYYSRSPNLARYSFLAGDAQYKRSLSTNNDTLYWAQLSRPSLSNWLENTARQLSGRLET